jgi:hypothetical protein
MNHRIALAVLLSIAPTPYCSATTLQDLMARYSPEGLEALVLIKLPQTKRDGKTLIIPTKKQNILFEDQEGDAQHSRHIRLIAYFDVRRDRRDYLVLEQYVEGQGFILINGATGEHARMLAEPVLSPSHQYYASAFHDKALKPPQTGLRIVKTSDYSERFTWRPPKQETGLAESAECVWESDDSLLVFEWIVHQGASSLRPARFKSNYGEWSGPHYLKDSPKSAGR